MATEETLETWSQILSFPLTSSKRSALTRELLSGITVSLAQVPEAVAFAFTANVDPIIGLHAAWILCFLTGIFGAQPGMISGATGAIASILPSFVEKHGVGFLFVTIMMMGIIQMILGALGAGKVVALIGAPVMIGFVNGLALIVGIAQFNQLKDRKEGGFYPWEILGWQIFIIILTMLTIYFLPKVSELKVKGMERSLQIFKHIPASLAGIIVGIILEFAIIRPAGFSTPLVKDIASVQGNFPKPVFIDPEYKNLIPSLTSAETYKICLPTAATLAIVGLIESLITLQLLAELKANKHAGAAKVFNSSANGMNEDQNVIPKEASINKLESFASRLKECYHFRLFREKELNDKNMNKRKLANKILRTTTKQECISQGFANFVIGLFGGMGGCAMIGQSVINVRSGGVTRISSVTCGICLLIIILVAYKIINFIPVASLVGVMFMVVIATFDWNSIRLIFHSAIPLSVRKKNRFHQKLKRNDVFIIVVVTVVAVSVNLAVAFFLGIIMSCVFFTWEQVKFFSVEPDLEGEGNQRPSEKAVRIYNLEGLLSFRTAIDFEAAFDFQKDPKIVELHVRHGFICDYSAIASINKVAVKYKKYGKTFRVRKVRGRCMHAVRKAKHLLYLYDKNISESKNDEEIDKFESDENLTEDGTDVNFSPDVVDNYYDAIHARVRNDGETQFQEPVERTSDSSNSSTETSIRHLEVA